VNNNSQMVVQQGKELCSSMTGEKDGLRSIDEWVTEPAREQMSREVMMRAPNSADLQALQVPRDWVLLAVETQQNRSTSGRKEMGTIHPKAAS
jgi:hypothetical protein